MADELIDIVTDDDIVAGQEMRSTAHQFGLQHRGVHVFLFTSDGKMLVQKRSRDRAQYPSALDCSVSEHVKAGESYVEAALRGLGEELGIGGATLRRLVKFRMNYGVNDNEISTLYEATVHRDEVRFDPVEIESIHYISLDELWTMVRSNKDGFCGWFVELLNWYAGRPSRIVPMD
jgi:isopentenyldiphosphate isomerase